MCHPFYHSKRCRKTPPSVRHTNNNQKGTKLAPITERHLKAAPYYFQYNLK